MKREKEMEQKRGSEGGRGKVNRNRKEVKRKKERRKEIGEA